MEALFAEVPELGIMVRDEADGFHARVSPAPPIPWRQTFVLGGLWTALCVGVAYALTGGTGPAAMIVAGGVLFGALLYGFQIGQGYFPVELAVSNGVMYVDGHRRPLDQVKGAILEGMHFEVLAVDGSVIGAIDGVTEEVGQWLVRAVAHMVREHRP